MRRKDIWAKILFVREIKPNFHQYPQCWAHSTTSRNSRGNGIWQCEKKEFDGIIEGGGVGGEAAPQWVEVGYQGAFLFSYTMG